MNLGNRMDKTFVIYVVSEFNVAVNIKSYFSNIFNLYYKDINSIRVINTIKFPLIIW